MLSGKSDSSTSGTAGLAQRVEFDLSAAQSGTLLYEVQLRPGAPAEAATVVLRWRDAADGAEHEETRLVTRSQLSLPPSRTSPNLQLAGLAAATAARLRNSPQADNLAPTVLLQWAGRLQRLRSVPGLEQASR